MASQKVLQKGEVVKIHKGAMIGKEGKILEVSSKNVVLEIEGIPGKVTVPREDLGDKPLELPDLQPVAINMGMAVQCVF